MRETIRALLKAFPPQEEERVREKAERGYREQNRILEEIRNNCAAACKASYKLQEAGETYANLLLEDTYANGLCYGILLGMTAADGAETSDAVLHRIFRGETFFERPRITGTDHKAAENMFDFWMRELEKELGQEQKKLSEDFYDCFFAICYNREESYAAAGMRRGISIGLAVGNLQKNLQK